MGVPPSPHDPETVRELADEILSQARYDQPPKSPWERLMDWVGERLADLLSTLAGGAGSFGAFFAWMVLLGVLGGVIYLLVRYGRITVPALAKDPEPEVMVELTRTAREWRAEADTLEAQGRWAEGLRCRYRALVADLVRRGVIPDQAGRTAGEYVRDVASRQPDAAPAFAAATELFEAVWYGGATTGAAEAARFQDLESRVLAVHA